MCQCREGFTGDGVTCRGHYLLYSIKNLQFRIRLIGKFILNISSKIFQILMSVQQAHHHAMQMLHVKIKLAVISVSAMKVFSYLMFVNI